MRLRRILKIILAAILAVNLYALSLRFLPVPGTILMVQRSLSGQDIQREWARLSDISPYMVQAVMAGEDGRFCEHEGIDWKAIEQAMTDNKTRARRRGGSTITQQTAKNVFFWNGGGVLRKAGEAWFASLIDYSWGKSRVMEVYLNVAEWGDGIFGVEAAAQARFNKSAKSLTKNEAALLAAVLPSPNKWRLDPPTDYVSGRAALLQKRMAIIRDSHYAKCVRGQKQESLAREKIETLEPETSRTDQVVDTDQETIIAPLSLEEVLAKAEKSLKKAPNPEP